MTNEIRGEIIKQIHNMSSIKEDTIDNKLKKLKLVRDILNKVISMMLIQIKEKSDISLFETECMQNMISKERKLINSIYKDI